MVETGDTEFDERVVLKMKMARLESEAAVMKSKLAEAEAARDSQRLKAELAVAIAERGYNKRIGLNRILAVAADGIVARASRAEDALMLDDKRTGKPYSDIKHFLEAFTGSNEIFFSDDSQPAKPGAPLPNDWRTSQGWARLSPEQREQARAELTAADAGKGGRALPKPDYLK